MKYLTLTDLMFICLIGTVIVMMAVSHTNRSEIKTLDLIDGNTENAGLIIDLIKEMHPEIVPIQHREAK